MVGLDLSKQTQNWESFTVLNFQINDQVLRQTTSKTVGHDVIQAVVDFIQQSIVQKPEVIKHLISILGNIAEEQSLKPQKQNLVLFSNHISGQMETIYNFLKKDLDSQRTFKDSNVIHSYHEYIAKVLNKSYAKDKDNLTILLEGFNKDSFVSTCETKSFTFGVAKNKNPTENNELLLMLIKICNQLKIKCIIKLIYASEEDSPQAVYEKLFALSPFIENKTKYVNPLNRTAKKSSALLFLTHFWSDHYSAYSKNHAFKDHLSVEVEEFTYDIDKGRDRQGVEQHFRDIFANQKGNLVDLSTPMKEFFGTCTKGCYTIVVSTRFQNEESIESPDIKDDIVIKLHPDYGHDAAIAGCEDNTLVFSNPNSGKTFGFKHRLSNRLFELTYQNSRSVTEWKKTVLIQHISRDYYVGTLLKAIATASLNPTKQFYVLADEVGTFNLDWILGSNLKKIFKKSQRIDFAEDNLQKRVSSLNTNELSLTAFKKLGEFIAEQPDNATKTTRFSEGEHEFVLWLPNNLHVVFLANYEDELLGSLSELKGWGPNGDRFNIVHYYAVQDPMEGVFFFEPNNLRPDQMKTYQNIRRWNSKICDKLDQVVKALSFSEQKSITGEMVVPRLLISTFAPNVPTSANLKEHILGKLDDFVLLSESLKQKLKEAITNIDFERE